jgi:hypothetical protein
MQQQFKTDEGGITTEPYIAAIVSPYDRRLPSLQSSVTWFRVEQGTPAVAAAAAGGSTGTAAPATGRLTFAASNKDALDQVGLLDCRDLCVWGVGVWGGAWGGGCEAKQSDFVLGRTGQPGSGSSGWRQ